MTKKTLLTSLFGLVFLFAPASATAVHQMACDVDHNGKINTQEAITCGAQSAGGDNQTAAGAEESINQTITSIVNILSVVVAIVAVIMIILGGFRYITSAGAADKVTSAKNTILYAIIGLIIVALAQTIVRFVVNQATSDPSCVNGKITTGVNKGKAC